jgi:hypothetical protein
MALEFSFNKTNLDLEDRLVLGGHPFGIPGFHSNTPRNTYTGGSAPVTKDRSRLEANFKFTTGQAALSLPTNENPDPTQFPATTLGSTNISGHFPTAGKPPEIFTQKYTPENTYLDQINSQ